MQQITSNKNSSNMVSHATRQNLLQNTQRKETGIKRTNGSKLSSIRRQYIPVVWHPGDFGYYSTDHRSAFFVCWDHGQQYLKPQQN